MKTRHNAAHLTRRSNVRWTSFVLGHALPKLRRPQPLGSLPQPVHRTCPLGVSASGALSTARLESSVPKSHFRLRGFRPFAPTLTRRMLPSSMADSAPDDARHSIHSAEAKVDRMPALSEARSRQCSGRELHRCCHRRACPRLPWSPRLAITSGPKALGGRFVDLEIERSRSERRARLAGETAIRDRGRTVPCVTVPAAQPG